MALLTRTRRIGAALVCAALAGVSITAEGQAIENDVKAAFLFNFTKFAEWPAAVATDGEPFRLCVMADSSFAQSLDAIIQGETVLGRPLVRAVPATSDEARRCQLLYIATPDRDQVTRLLDAVRNAPVLTVGDKPRFLESGGAIQFVVDKNRVRFDVNVRAADRAGIRLSSKLLRVARTVLVEGRPER